jgi:molecular chaperone DnaK
VAFDIDANGILNVSAKDKGTGKEQKIRIEASTGLSKEEVERMKNEAAANSEVDKAAREKIDKINAADSLVFQTEKQLTEFGDKIPGDKKGAIEAAVAALKEAHKSEDLAGIDNATKTLNDAWAAASQDIYQAQQGAEGAAGATADNGSSGADSTTSEAEDVTDVEFEEVDDKK